VTNETISMTTKTTNKIQAIFAKVLPTAVAPTALAKKAITKNSRIQLNMVIAFFTKGCVSVTPEDSKSKVRTNHANKGLKRQNPKKTKGF